MLTKAPRAAGREVEAGEAGAPGAARDRPGGARAGGEALEMVGLVRQAPGGIFLPLQQRVGSWSLPYVCTPGLLSGPLDM